MCHYGAVVKELLARVDKWVRLPATLFSVSLSYHFFSSLTVGYEQTSLNRSQQLPAPYKRLIDEMKRN